MPLSSWPIHSLAALFSSRCILEQRNSLFLRCNYFRWSLHIVSPLEIETTHNKKMSRRDTPQKDNDDEVVHLKTQTVFEVVAARTAQAEREGRIITIDGGEDDEPAATVTPKRKAARRSNSTAYKRKKLDIPPEQIIVIDSDEEDEESFVPVMPLHVFGDPTTDRQDDAQKEEEETDKIPGIKSESPSLEELPKEPVESPKEAVATAAGVGTATTVDDAKAEDEVESPAATTTTTTAAASAAATKPLTRGKHTVQFNASKYSTDIKWIQEMAYWLESGKGGQTKLCSERNAKDVLSKVTRLAKGEGITYHKWPSDICFYGGQKVDLTFDFKQMRLDALKYEKKYGKDSGHGWLLTHPIKKLQLYQEYLGLKPGSSST